MTRRRLVALLAGLGALAVLLGILNVGGASGQDDPRAPSGAVSVQAVDARGDRVVASGSVVGAPVGDLGARVDGRRVEAEVTDAAGLPLDVVAVVDNASVLGNGTVQLAKQSLAPLLPGGTVARLGVVSTGGTARVVSPLTADAGAVENALRTVMPSGGSDLWGALQNAGRMLQASGPDRTRVVVVLAAAPVGGSATVGTAENSLRLAGARLDAVVLPRGVDVEALAELSGSLGGSVTRVATDGRWAAGVESVDRGLAGRFELAFTPPAGTDGDRLLTVSAADASTTVRYVPGALRTGSESLTPPAEESGGLLRALTSNTIVLWLVVLLGAAAVVVALWTALNMVIPDDDGLARRLRVYEDPYGEQAAADEEAAAAPVDTSVATVPILRRAVDFTGEMAERRGLLDKLEGDLERANLPLRAAEAVFFTVVGALVLGLLAFVITSNPMPALLVVLVAVALPRALLSAKVRKRQKTFEAQLPDMLALMAGTLRAGYSIGQGFEAVSKEMDDPMGRELRRVVTENRLGRPLDEALESVAERMQSDDFSWAVMAIRIQREVGGNLAELLLTVANTMTQRERLRRDVATLTAEGRMSAIVLGLLPPGLGAVMFVMNPAYISKLFEPGLGYFLIGAGVAAMLVGFAWMKKIITIEV